VFYRARMMLAMTVRIEYLADHAGAIPQLARWHHAEWAALFPHVNLADREARLRDRVRRGSIPIGFVALANDAIVGMGSLIACDLESHSHLSPWLAGVLVAPTHRGMGVGSALSERIVTEARAL